MGPFWARGQRHQQATSMGIFTGIRGPGQGSQLNAQISKSSTGEQKTPKQSVSGCQRGAQTAPAFQGQTEEGISQQMNTEARGEPGRMLPGDQWSTPPNGSGCRMLHGLKTERNQERTEWWWWWWRERCQICQEKIRADLS